MPIFSRSNRLFLLFLTALCAVFLLAQNEAQAAGGKQKKGKKSAKSSAKKAAPSPEKITRESVNLQKQRFEQLQKSIENTRAQLQQINKKENSVNQSLNLNRKQSEQLQSYLTLLEGQLGRLKDSISTAEKSLNSLSSNLETLQKSYAELCQIIYKAGESDDKELIVTGKPHDEELRQKKYIENITALANDRAAQIANLKDSIAHQKEVLSQFFKQNTQIKHQKEQRQKELEQSIQGHQQALKAIRSDKSQLEKQLREKNESAKKIQRIISLLIEKEMKRKAEEARRQAENERRRKEAEERKRERIAEAKKQPAPSEKPEQEKPTKGKKKKNIRGKHSETKKSPELAQKPSSAPSKSAEEPRPAPESYSGGAFKARSLPWPVPSKTILHKFGAYTNPATKITIENLGIGVKTPRGTGVSAVGDGTVSLVHWLPGYGSLVIIDHHNGFRTVYANLSGVSVAEGQKIKAGGMVGRSGESVDGEYLHFEIWKERQKLNPQAWLR